MALLFWLFHADGPCFVFLCERGKFPGEFRIIRSSGQTATIYSPVCTENLNPDVVVMKSAKDRV